MNGLSGIASGPTEQPVNEMSPISIGDESAQTSAQARPPPTSVAIPAMALSRSISRLLTWNRFVAIAVFSFSSTSGLRLLLERVEAQESLERRRRARRADRRKRRRQVRAARVLAGGNDQLRVVEGRALVANAVVGERDQERDQRGDLILGQRERSDQRRQRGIREIPAVVVQLHGLTERGLAPVVEVGAAQ